MFARVIVPAIAALFVTLGCASEDGVESGSKDESSPALARATRVQYSALGVPPSIKVAADGVGSTTMALSSMESSPLEPRMVIKTAMLYCEVADYDSASIEIQHLADDRRGYVVGSTVEGNESSRKSGSIVLRVPVDTFNDTLMDLRALVRRVERENVHGNDVTEEFYDLTARLENKKKAEKRFQEILVVAKTSEDILQIEQALSTVREEIERLEGRKRFIENQTALSTITISMHEPFPVVATTADTFWAKLTRGMGQGVERALDGLVGAVSAGVTLVIVGVPSLLGVALLWLVLVRSYRRLRSRAAAPAETG